MKALRELANGTVRPHYSVFATPSAAAATALQPKYPDLGPTTVSKQVASTLREIIIPLYSAIVR